jgi:hypothetical protein
LEDNLTTLCGWWDSLIVGVGVGGEGGLEGGGCMLRPFKSVDVEGPSEIREGVERNSAHHLCN